MSALLGFIAGVAVAALAFPAADFLKKRYRRAKVASTLSTNQVTTVSQVLHLAVQGAPTGIVVVDRTGDVILSNGKAHDMGIVHERTVNEQVWSVTQEVFDDQETRTLDLQIPKRRTGSRVTAVQALIQPLTLVDLRYNVIYSTDESENVRMEAARRDFVANVSHELKTPVGGMALLAEALLESSDDPESVEYFGTRLHKEAHRMADMINELISLSKLQGAEALPDMEPVLVDDVVTDAISRTQLAADNANIRISSGRPSGVFVNGDHSLLVTAVANLISNAINYSPQSTPVTVSQKVTGDGTILIRVTDRGIGISAEDQVRVFERFFRVDKARSRSTGGTGLGLAIVKHVAHNHGGTIKLWSRPGTGSTFTLELPIYDPDSEAQQAPELAPEITAARRSRVLPRRKDESLND
ncbi:Signal-transduction histidine kinase senX3 [Corynebacterium kalinowskii]|uniref:Sensor-like histidine kinase SenX3 n=1 Tax=Corynebacterium kalinowskii TaxID=2675216 RepID=A0A6B8VFR4_9CORY|nr:ATP-binding protein [Corynebacterium kalinowskii]QGU02963.1 Signal-transduction histidine kinase senX3 [Corynebacterium kalinowskii]